MGSLGACEGNRCMDYILPKFDQLLSLHFTLLLWYFCTVSEKVEPLKKANSPGATQTVHTHTETVNIPDRVELFDRGFHSAIY